MSFRTPSRAGAASQCEQDLHSGARDHTGVVGEMPLNPEGINKGDKDGGTKMFSKQSWCPVPALLLRKCFHCEPVAVAACYWFKPRN